MHPAGFSRFFVTKRGDERLHEVACQLKYSPICDELTYYIVDQLQFKSHRDDGQTLQKLTDITIREHNYWGGRRYRFTPIRQALIRACNILCWQRKAIEAHFAYTPLMIFVRNQNDLKNIVSAYHAQPAQKN